MFILGGGVSINGTLGKDPWRLCKDYLWQCSPWGGGQSTVNLVRICKDFARITSDNVDPGGSIDGQLGKDPWRLCKDYLWQCSSQGGGSINSQLGKDPQRLCKDYLWQCWSWGQSTVNLVRICKDFARTTFDNVDPWKGGSIDGQHGKDPWRLCKDYLWQCWFWREGIDWQSTC